MNNYRIDKDLPIALLALKTDTNVIRGARYVNEADDYSYVDILYKSINTNLASKYPSLPTI